MAILGQGEIFTYGTGFTSRVSDEGWTWRNGLALPLRQLALDVIYIGIRYFLYTAENSGETNADVSMTYTIAIDSEASVLIFHLVNPHGSPRRGADSDSNIRAP
jgi:hypothetical protein